MLKIIKALYWRLKPRPNEFEALVKWRANRQENEVIYQIGGVEDE